MKPATIVPILFLLLPVIAHAQLIDRGVAKQAIDKEAGDVKKQVTDAGNAAKAQKDANKKGIDNRVNKTNKKVDQVADSAKQAADQARSQEELDAIVAGAKAAMWDIAGTEALGPFSHAFGKCNLTVTIKKIEITGGTGEITMTPEFTVTTDQPPVTVRFWVVVRLTPVGGKGSFIRTAFFGPVQSATSPKTFKEPADLELVKGKYNVQVSLTVLAGPDQGAPVPCFTRKQKGAAKGNVDVK